MKRRRDDEITIEQPLRHRLWYALTGADETDLRGRTPELCHALWRVGDWLAVTAKELGRRSMGSASHSHVIRTLARRPSAATSTAAVGLRLHSALATDVVGTARARGLGPSAR